MSWQARGALVGRLAHEEKKYPGESWNYGINWVIGVDRVWKCASRTHSQ
jgi:hypothetical protein